MISIEFVRSRIRELFEKFERENFNIAEALMVEAGYNEGELNKTGITKTYSSDFFSFLCEELYKIGLEKRKIPNELYLIKHLPRKEYIYIGKRDKKEAVGYKELFPGIILHKEIFYKILDALNLNDTKEAYCNYLIINNEEFTESKESLLRYFSEKQIEKYNSFDNVKKVLEDEYSKKLKNKDRFIKIHLPKNE